eukprot:GEMP01008758.1.p1 GENE.GEMP01008758.1~~GEMP01008758.1.p1  ORF type:complete len:849 (+),score=169.98 GEMP01008758.1:56-2602(+)
MRTAVPRNRTSHRARSPCFEKPVPRKESGITRELSSLDEIGEKWNVMDTPSRGLRKPKAETTVASLATGTQAAAYGIASRKSTVSVLRQSENGSAKNGNAARQSQPSRLNVVVRKRPTNKKEIESHSANVVDCKHNGVIVKEPKLRVDLTKYVEEHTFQFDHSFDAGTQNEELYEVCVRPLVDAAFNVRAKCTCFAYGQTGSGKTFTMMGGPGVEGEDKEKTKQPGVFLLAARDIFSMLESKQHQNVAVYIAFYEIYCGKLFDLLNNRQPLQPRENAKNKVIIVGLQEQRVRNGEELMEVIEYGLASRTTGVTGANVDSSRSHAILQICLKQVDDEGRLISAEHVGKLSFIDLAGSERGADTLDQDRQTRMDGAEINKSLLALKECIRALDQQLDHTPFRGSRLTQVLKDSFIGDNCFTLMIANVSPCAWAVEHSLNTLRYAYRVKELRRHPVDNSRPHSQIGGRDTNAIENRTVKENCVHVPTSGREGEEDITIERASSSEADSPTANREVNKERVPSSGSLTTKANGNSPETISPPTTSSDPVRSRNVHPPNHSTNHVHPHHQNPHHQNHHTTNGHPAQASSRAGDTFPSDALDPGERMVVTQPVVPDRQTSHHAAVPERLSIPDIAGTHGHGHADVERQSMPDSGSDRLFERVSRIEPEPAKALKFDRPMADQLKPVLRKPSCDSHEIPTGISLPHAKLAGLRTASEKLATHERGDEVVPAARDEEPPEVALEPMNAGQSALNELARAHDKLIGTILAEEEELIAAHRLHIDYVVDLIKQEMLQLSQVDRPGSDVDSYVASLDRSLQMKMDSIVQLRQRLSIFQEHLLQEDALSKKFQERSAHSN